MPNNADPHRPNDPAKSPDRTSMMVVPGPGQFVATVDGIHVPDPKELRRILSARRSDAASTSRLHPDGKRLVVA